MKKNLLLTQKRLRLGVFFLVLFFSKSIFAKTDFEVRGLDKDLKKNVEVYLDSIPENERIQNFRFQSGVKEKITQALQAKGYFNPKINFDGQKKTMLGKEIVIISVNAGEPIRLLEADVEFLGEAAKDPEFLALLKTVPKVGDVLDQGVYENIKANIQRLAINRGYFDGKFTQTKLEVAPSLNEGYMFLQFDSGIRYQYGQIHYYNSQINHDRLDSLRDFSTGEPYLVSELSEFNQALAGTEWFSSALVETDVKNLKDGVVPVIVNLDPAPRNLFETGVGYSTNTGARFKVSWNKPWVNERGHSLDTSFYISSPKQTLESSYKIPLKDVEHEFYKLQLGLEHLDFNDTESLELSASVSRHWLYETGWQRILFLRWLYSDFTQAGVSENSNLHFLGVNFSRVRTRGGVMPYWGDKQSITFEVASELWGSDMNLYRVFGETAWIRSLDKENTHRFITRVQAGLDVTENIEAVPPSLRFFSGGDNSIRGYSYDSISPKDESGELIGGEYMVTASLEYNYQFTKDWWLAIFSDLGDSWTGVSPEWKVSSGIGVRWKSPVGPIRFDIAHGFQNETDNFMLHFSLGPEL